jgi:hypothetical protein
MTALILGALVAVAAVVLVALPFLREADGDDQLETSSPAEDQRLAWSEERDRTLAALKELEFDHTTGKVSDEDYRSLVGPLRRTAADALRAIDAIDAASAASAANPAQE